MTTLSKEEFYKLIGKNVAKIRKEKGLSQMKLSLEMGYESVSVVSSAEVCYRGKHFNLGNLHQIAQILDVEFCEFFSKEES
jgi:transcriptional regulator with XRE-family HTH domain